MVILIERHYKFSRALCNPVPVYILQLTILATICYQYWRCVVATSNIQWVLKANFPQVDIVEFWVSYPP